MYYNKTNELYHHGILGQKWGVRRYQQKNGRLTAAGKYHVKEQRSKSSDDAQNGGLTDQQKKYLKTGAAIAAGLLVAYGGYKISTSPKVRALTTRVLYGSKDKRLSDIDATIEVMGPEIVRKEKMPDLFGQVGSSRLNELFGNFNRSSLDKNEIDDFFSSNENLRLGIEHEGLSKNCIACALQNALSKSGVRGYKARSSLQVDSTSGMVIKKGFSLSDVKDAFEGTEIKTARGKNWRDLKTELAELGEGAAGIIGTTRIDESGKRYRHAISFKVDNGRTVLADNQGANIMLDQLREDGIQESLARRMVYETLSDLSEDFLGKTSLFTSSPKDEVRFIRIDNATKVIPDKLDKLLY